MKLFLSIAGAILGCILLCFGIGWLAEGNALAMFKFFAPKQEAARRQVFEQTKSYNQGMVQELDQFYREYSAAPKEQKTAIRAVVLHRVADFPSENLPPYLQAWVSELRNPDFNSFKENSK